MLQIKHMLKFNLLKKLYIEERTKRYLNKETRYGIFSISKSKEFIDFTKNFLQLQYTSIQNQVQYATSQMTAIQREYSGQDDSDYTDDANYIYYEDLSDQLETEKDSIDSQLTAIENEISGLKTLVNNNIKSSCTLNLLNS